MKRGLLVALGVLLMVVSGFTWTNLVGTKRGWLLGSEVRLRLLVEPDEDDFVRLPCAEDGTCHAYLRSGEAVRLDDGGWVYLVYNWSIDAPGTTWASNIGDVALAIDSTGQMYVSEQQQCVGWLVSLDSAAGKRSVGDFWAHAGRYWRRYPRASPGASDSVSVAQGDCGP